MWFNRCVCTYRDPGNSVNTPALPSIFHQKSLVDHRNQLRVKLTHWGSSLSAGCKTSYVWKWSGVQAYKKVSMAWVRCRWARYYSTHQKHWMQTTGELFRVEAVKELSKSRSKQWIESAILQGLLKVEMWWRFKASSSSWVKQHRKWCTGHPMCVLSTNNIFYCHY